MNPKENPEALTALVVDDERLARKELISLLEAYPHIRVVGQADDVESAISEINKTNPDVVFLDIQMPRKSGFDLLEEIHFDGRIIFVTAYDEYAIRAFEVNALDYLLKPVSPERLELAIRRLTEQQPPATHAFRRLQYTDSLFLTLGTRMAFIRVSQIIAITAEKDYTMVFLSNEKNGLTGKSMKEWDDRLPESHFTRIHRSAIINIDKISRVDKWFNNCFKVYMEGLPEPLIVSRRYSRILREKYA